MKRALVSLVAVLASSAALAGPAAAQFGPPPGPPPTPKAGAPVDLTGQWVSVVTEDWRWRMITPPKGEFSSVPLNAEGTKAGNAWDLAADDAAGLQCKAYGVGGLLRQPGRIRVSWVDDNTLKLETDAGQQVRTLKFVSGARGGILPQLAVRDAAPAQPTLQGQSKAQWFKQPQSRGLGFGGSLGDGGALRVVTQNVAPGYLRKNGVPYSANAVVTEQFNRHEEPNGDIWLTVTTIVDDPQYLSTPFITSTSFKKEADQSKWSPSPCRTDPPAEPPVPSKGG